MKLALNSTHPIPTSLSLIAAGPAVEIGEDYELLDINALITNGRAGYIAFEVTGDSMPPIQSGNLIFVDTWAEARNGSLIAAEVNDRICVKIFNHSPPSLYLVSSNESYRPQRIGEKDNFRILGVVKGYMGICK